MRTLALGALAALALALTAAPLHAQQLGEVPRTDPTDSAPRGEVLEWTTPEGQPYWYRLPESSSRKKPALVLMLHGTGLNHGWSFWNYPIANGRFRGDDIVISPDGLTPGQGETFNFMQGKQDGDQIAGLIELFRERFDIGNVYLYGHSQGAFFCYWFAGEHPELVDGIVAHAGNVLDVKHSKLSRSKVAIGILHADSDQVVPVECATRTEEIYREQGYEKLKCWIVEGIRPEAGHWPLPDHVATMFEWLDEVSTSDASQAVEVARAALRRTPPDFALAARIANEARETIKKYKGDDKDRVVELLELIEEALANSAANAWAQARITFNQHEEGKQPGVYAADVRWAQRMFGQVEKFQEVAKQPSRLFAKHDKLFEKLERIKDKDSKSYAKALLDALEEGYLSTAWDEAHAAAVARCEDGWRPLDDLPEQLEALAAANGTEPVTGVVLFTHMGFQNFCAEHPQLLAED
jgi:pimeloyl-ACP methyl ester carboxylesterase